MKPHLVIVGLGNPGREHAATRHNTGFRAVETLSKRFGTGAWKESQKFLCRMQEGRIVTVPVLLVQPSTYMNRSGECLRKLTEFYKLNPREQVLVICDDIDLSPGTVRLRRKGGPGTHNGLRSIAVIFGDEFPRLRVGIGAPARRSRATVSPPERTRTATASVDDDLSAWVLSVPSDQEREDIDTAIALIPDTVKRFVLERLEEGNSDG